MVLISDVLRDPIGNPRVGVAIILKSIKTSATVLNMATSKSVTDENGHYSFSVEPGAYDVVISAYGEQPQRVGNIVVSINSQPGTLNDFLTIPNDADLNPAIVATVDRMRADAAASALAAKNSETLAAKSVEVVTGKADKSSLGTAATRDVQTSNFDATANRLMTNGAWGLGSAGTFAMGASCQFLASIGGSPEVPGNGAGWQSAYASTRRAQSFMTTNGVFHSRFSMSPTALDSTTQWSIHYTTSNTTVDSNGFIKRASPIGRLSNNPDGMDADYIDGFTLAGCVAVNAEAEGVTAERVSTGIYHVTGSLGFAKESWKIEVPQDMNGNFMCFVATETAEDGTITVTVSKRRFDIDTATIVAGERMDIPEGRWIDLRLEMPADSIWNLEQKEMQAALDSDATPDPSDV